MNGPHPNPHERREVRDLLAFSRSICPDFEMERVLQRTGKSLLIAGTFRGEPAVAKLLTDRGAFWQTRFLHEIEFYRAIQEGDPPIRIPQLLHADNPNLMMIQELLPGEPMADARHPSKPVDLQGFRALLNTLPALHAWMPWPTPDPETIVLDYENRLAKHLQRGFLSPEDVDRGIRLLHSISWTPEFNHGDLLLTNCLFDTVQQRIALIDWEYAGYLVPGYDLALLYTLSLHDENQHAMITRVVQESGEKGSALFLVNLLILLARETHNLRELQHIDLLRSRTTLVTTELEQTRHLLHARFK